jgi:hypothetical protein
MMSPEDDLTNCRSVLKYAGCKTSKEQGATVYGGQAIKGIRWMPRHQEAKKDVAKLRKVAGSCKQALIRKCPNRETDME